MIEIIKNPLSWETDEDKKAELEELKKYCEAKPWESASESIARLLWCTVAEVLSKGTEELEKKLKEQMRKVLKHLESIKD